MRRCKCDCVSLGNIHISAACGHCTPPSLNYSSFDVAREWLRLRDSVCCVVVQRHTYSIYGHDWTLFAFLGGGGGLPPLQHAAELGKEPLKWRNFRLPFRCFVLIFLYFRKTWKTKLPPWLWTMDPVCAKLALPEMMPPAPSSPPSWDGPGIRYTGALLRILKGQRNTRTLKWPTSFLDHESFAIFELCCRKSIQVSL